MVSSLSQKIEELKAVIRLHSNWLVYAVLGDTALTKAELSELRNYGKLPMGKELNLVENSYLLGRLRATLKRGEFRSLDYQDVSLQAKSLELTPLEELVLEQAKLRAGQSLKKLANSVASVTVDAVQQSLGSSIAEDAVRSAVASEVLSAIAQRKSGQQLANSLASKLGQAYKRNWTSVAMTELHAAKVQGAAQAIINRRDIYANSDGANSTVSIIPAASCCADCRKHYLDSDGNPKVFKLLTLLGAGSNADEGVSHLRSGKHHVSWKTTLPPLHPGCGCQIQYVPPGYAWTNGKLELLNKSLFEETLKKATAGVSGGISSTVAPKGPSGNTPTSAKPAGVPSMPGAAAPTNKPGPGRPPGGGSGSGGSGGSQHSPCPFGGGAECISHGGNGAALHKQGGSIMKKHQEAMARGATPVTEEAKEQQEKMFDAQATAYNQQQHPEQTLVDHFSEGRVAHSKRLGEADGGKNVSYKITIEGNGSGMMKPAIDYDSYVDQVYKENAPTDLAERKKLADNLTSPGAGTIPAGMHPKCEVGAYLLGKSLGINIPTTTLRNHDGEGGGPAGLNSVMHWQDDAVDIDVYLQGAKAATYYEALIKATPDEHKARMHEQLSELAVADIIWNNNDRHWGNIMVDPGTHNIVPIDHGVSFGNGLAGSLNRVAHEMHSSGIALEVSPRMQQRLKNMSLGETMRSLDASGLPDYMKGQTFLRQRYVLHLQETFDHVPFDKIRGSQFNHLGQSRAYDDQWEDAGPGVALANYWMAEAEGNTPHQKFESWAKGYMSKAAADPTHPDHADAKKLLDMNVLRSSAHVSGREEASKESLQKHFDSIPEYDFEAEQASASRIKSEKPKGKKFHSEVAPREAPAVEEKKTPKARPLAKQKESAQAVDVDLSELTSSAIELSPEDIEVIEDAQGKIDLEGGRIRTTEKVESQDTLKQTKLEQPKLELDLDELDDWEIEDAFERIQTKKSLVLANPSAKFPVDFRALR